MLLMQGALDDNVLPAVQEKFAATYRAAGGHCQLEIFEGSEHEWVAKPGPQTDRARAMVKAFIAEQLSRTYRPGLTGPLPLVQAACSAVRTACRSKRVA